MISHQHPVSLEEAKVENTRLLDLEDLLEETSNKPASENIHDKEVVLPIEKSKEPPITDWKKTYKIRPPIAPDLAQTGGELDRRQN